MCSDRTDLRTENTAVLKSVTLIMSRYDHLNFLVVAGIDQPVSSRHKPKVCAVSLRCEGGDCQRRMGREPMSERHQWLSKKQTESTGFICFVFICFVRSM